MVQTGKSFCEGPDGKYLELCRPACSGVTPQLLFCYSTKEKQILDNTELNEHGYVPVTFYLQTLKFEFHIIVRLQNNLISLNHLKM